MSGKGERSAVAADSAVSAEPGPDAATVRAQLHRILTHKEFGATERNQRFLAFVVNETLEGRGERIKAYTIATDVFGRDSAFDPQSDPIVRVEAGQLRRALDRFYLSAGRQDQVEIAIPKGGYAPQFTWREGLPAPTPVPNSATPVRSSRRWRILTGVAATIVVLGVALATVLWRQKIGSGQPDIPKILVQPFQDQTVQGNSGLIARGLTQEVISQISKFRDIVVIVADDKGNPPMNPGAVQTDAPRYVLTGSLDLDESTMRLQAQMVSRSDGVVIWANSFTGDLSAFRLNEIEASIAQTVATTLAQPYGVIFQADSKRKMIGQPEDWTAYACTLGYYAYRVTLDPAAHAVSRRCLEDAVARFPDYATAWALLSQIYVDELRFRFAPDTAGKPASIQRALDAARKAVALDPTNIRGLQAEMFALYFSGEMDSALRVGKTALEMNPSDSELMGEYGFRLALHGEWDDGCALMSRAYERSPGPAGYYESGLALCAYQRGDMTEATMWIRKSPLPNNPQYHAIAAAIYGESGDPAVAAEVAWLRDHAPQYFDNARAEIAYRIGRKEDVDRMVASLKKAGVPVSEP